MSTPLVTMSSSHAIFASTLLPQPRPVGVSPTCRTPVGLSIDCSSRPQKKATAHHRRSRPKKTQPWDIKRKGPTAYPPLQALPPDWTLVGHQEEEVELEEAAVEVSENVS